MHGVSAMPIERTLATDPLAIAVTAARSSPRAAAAPAIFSTSTVPPTPRRPAVQVESLTATSSSMTTELDLDVLCAGELGGGLEVQHVAGVVLHDVQHARAGADGLRGREHWSGVGEVNTAPGTAASSIPAPTNPPCNGSCPQPPPETSATLPGTGASDPGDEVRTVADVDQVGVRGREALATTR